MKRFLAKYSLALNVIFTVIFLVAAAASWFEFFEEQKSRSIIGGVVFTIFSIIRGISVYTLWVKRKQNVNANYEEVENHKNLE